MNEPTIHDKNYTTAQKIDHFWTYYKWHTLVVVFIVGIIVSIVVTVFNKKEVALQVMAFDTGTISDRDIAKDFEEYAGVDTKQLEVIAQMNGSLENESDYFAVANSAKIMAAISAKELDVLMMNMTNFQSDIEDGAFIDLSTVFSEEELKDFSEVVTDATGKIVGIKTTSLSGFATYGYYQNGENAAVGIVANSQRVELAKQFILFLKG